MTQTQRAALDAAIERAQRQSIRVAGRGIRKADGARVFAVTSASQPGRWYLVAIEGGPQGARLHCDCPARSYCKHRAAVHEALRAELEASRQADAQADAQAATAARERIREAAVLARNDRPFSIWRAE